jgi:chorismate synthase
VASNWFGQIFRITTFGESHGPAIGVVIDGCPAGLPISAAEIDEKLALRRPGNNPHTSPRKEPDRVEILSGIFAGQTTGTPIAMLIRNQDADPTQYAAVEGLYRPGHANFTYQQKYGICDARGGGRSSARETAVRVAAGAVAKKLLSHHGIDCVAFVSELGGIAIGEVDLSDLYALRIKVESHPIFCPDEVAGEKMISAIAKVKEERDSLGAILSCVARLPVGLGDPVYCKLEAQLASAMLSIPATKGFEIGEGFAAARMRGSQHNDAFTLDDAGRICTKTNHAGGTLGGISTGAPLLFRIAFKPTSSIKRPQESVSFEGEKATFQLPESARHDPCVAIRAVPIIEAMTALVLADALLMQSVSKNFRYTEINLQLT